MSDGDRPGVMGSLSCRRLLVSTKQRIINFIYFFMSRPGPRNQNILHSNGE